VMSALFGEPDSAPREPVMFAKANDSSAPSAATASAFGAPWYLANAMPVQNSESTNAISASSPPAVAAVAQATPAPAVMATQTAQTVQTVQTVQTALAPQAVPASNSDNSRIPPLTPAQQALLDERNASDSGNIASVAPAAGASTNAISLSPEQEQLLLQSVGLAPKKPAAVQAPSDPTPAAAAPAAEAPTSEAPAMAAPAADDLSGDVVRSSFGDNDPSDDSADMSQSGTPQPGSPQPGPAVHAGGLRPANDLPVSTNTNFAQRMKFGLDRYLAHPIPVNTQPPHLDVIR
jgi:hypothetical protein